MAIGSDGLGWIAFDDYELARRIGIIALALILFEGGLTSGPLEIRPVLAPALSLAIVGTLVTAVVTGFAAVGLFDLSTLNGLLLGSVLAATDGAAIFALLRGSTLKRRLATTLEGESGFNDPVAVLLVLGFDRMAAERRLRHRRHGRAVRPPARDRAGRRRRRRRCGGLGAAPGAARHGRALSRGDARRRGDRLRRRRRAARLGLPRRLPRRPCAGRRRYAGAADRHLVPSGARMGGAGDDVRLARAARVPEPASTRSRCAGPCSPSYWCSSRAPSRSRWRHCPRGSAGPSASCSPPPGLRGAVPVVLATFPVLAGVSGSAQLFDVVFFAVLVSTVVQGVSFEPFAHWLGATTNEPALPRPLAEAGTIRRLGAEVLEYPIGPEDARRRRARARPRPAARSGGQRHRPRRRGDPAPRLDDPARGRSPARAAALRAVARRAHHRRALAQRPHRRAAAAAGAAAGSSATVHRAAVRAGGDRRRRRAAEHDRRRAGHGAAADPSRRARRPRRARRRALRGGRPIGGDGGRQDLSAWAMRRLRRLDAGDDERGWLQNVVGALAADVPE